MRRLPWISLALVAVAIAVYLTPGAVDRLVYDRALVEAGQWWRLATAVLVHFSASHLAWDAVALLGAACVAERTGRARFALVCAAAAIASSLAVHAFQSELRWYGGLSALAWAALALAAIERLMHDRDRRVLWLAVLVALSVKVWLELTTSRTLLTDGGLRVATAGHLAAVVVALSVVLSSERRRLRAALASLLLPLLSACTLHGHANFTAPAAPRVLALAAASSDTTMRRARVRVGVLMPREQVSGVRKEIIAPEGSLQAPISELARRAAADSAAAVLARDTTRFARVVSLPADVAQLPPNEVASRFGVDALCWLGYTQQLDAHDDGLSLLHLSLLFSPWIYPALTVRTRTIVDLAVVRVADGALLAHATGTSTHDRRAVPMRLRGAVRGLRERDLASAASDAARQALGDAATP